MTTGKDTEAPSGDGLQKIVSSLPVDHSGTTVYLKGWRLDVTTRPPIVIVHDLGELADAYQSTAETFARAGYTTYVFDLRGHGRSGRRLGHAPSFQTLVKDLLQVAAWVRHKENSKAPIILGHGIGALVAMEFTKRHGSFCRAAILSAPCMEPLGETSILIRFALKALAEALPTYLLPKGLFPRFARDLLTSSNEAAPRLSAALAHELLEAIKRADVRFIEYHGSVLILCPEQDEVVSFGHLKKSAALHTENNLQIATLAGVGHRVFTGVNEHLELAMQVILPWLESQNAARPLADGPAEPKAQSATRASLQGNVVKPGATKE